MYFFPFIKRKYKTNLSPEKVQEVFRKTTSAPYKMIDGIKLSNLRIFESKISEKGFVIVMGRYDLSYGKTSLLPIMKSTFCSSKGNNYTDISISLHPFETGSIIFLIYYFLAAAGLIILIQKELLKELLFHVFFFNYLLEYYCKIQ